MAYYILAATAHAPFGELLRLSLEETRRYRVQVVESGSDAAWQLESGQNYVVAIVDGDLQDLPLELLAEQARQGLRLFLIPPSNPPGESEGGAATPGLTDLPLTGTITRPFYLPDLLDRVAQAVEDLRPAGRPMQPSWSLDPAPPAAAPLPAPQSEAAAVQPQPSSTETEPPDTPQVDPAALFREQFSQTGALCGMWAGSGHEPILAGLDGLEQSAADPVAGVLRGMLNGNSPKGRRSASLGSWIRFVQLPLAEKECKVYITALPVPEGADGGEFVALVFPGETTLSQIRAQAGQMTRALQQAVPAGFFSVKMEEPDHEIRPTEETGEPDSDIRPTEEAGAERNLPAEEDRWYVEETSMPVAEADADAEEELSFPGLAALLGSFPDPNPPAGAGLPAKAGLPAGAGTPSSAQLEAVFGPEDFPWNIKDDDTQPVLIPGKSQPRKPAGADPFAEPPADPQEDTQPHPFLTVQSSVLTPPTSISQLEAEAPGLSQIYYTCVLIPRMPGHYLTREIGDSVGQWLQQLCLAFDWRLEGLAIRPEYLQWMVQVSPSVSPGELVKVIRQHTSQTLFNTFPQLREENPSDDFWAAGFLVISGAQPPAARLLREFIRATRRRQGVVLPGESDSHKTNLLETPTPRE